MLYNSSHLRNKSINFLSISEDKNRQQLPASKLSKCSGGDVRLDVCWTVHHCDS